MHGDAPRESLAMRGASGKRGSTAGARAARTSAQARRARRMKRLLQRRRDRAEQQPNCKQDEKRMQTQLTVSPATRARVRSVIAHAAAHRAARPAVRSLEASNVQQMKPSIRSDQQVIRASSAEKIIAVSHDSRRIMSRPWWPSSHFGIRRDDSPMHARSARPRARCTTRVRFGRTRRLRARVLPGMAHACGAPALDDFREP